jgi:hypothetical protein
MYGSFIYRFRPKQAQSSLQHFQFYRFGRSYKVRLPIFSEGAYSYKPVFY